MKKIKQTIILLILIIAIILITNQYVFAAKSDISAADYISMVEFSDDFEKWIELSESEKATIIQPKMYDELNTPFVVNNPLYQVNLVGASINSRYSLKDVIPSNVAIRNQYDTSMCWAFAGLSSLETNLALRNYKTGENTSKVYDFSERHVNYATARLFSNNTVNSYGFNRTAADGGQWLLVENYLTNGQGAINESAMPFENNSNVININEIQNKEIQTRVYDTVYFDDYNELTGNDKTEAMNQVKQHIQNYGSVFCTIHGDSSDAISYSCYNNDTGAKYCNDSETHEIDHAVSIIGWDDNYSVDNFAEGAKPSSNGAWIVRNSWGENLEYDLAELKQELFNEYPNECRSRGWNSASEIPNSFIESAGYTISGNKVLFPVGDHGYMYVSYEDCNVATTLYGITKATDSKDYNYIYQYNELYPGVQINFSAPSTYLCNIFEKQSSDKEYLTEVALTVPETYTCKVYVNPNGTGKSKSDLQLVQLKAGESETVDIGYHTLEFAEPIEIKSSQFAVAVEIQGTRSSVDILTEGKIPNVSMFDYAKTETGKCFVASSTDLDTCTWFDLGRLEEASETLTNGDSSLKAFTTTAVEDTSLNRIEIATPPTRTAYIEGENFEKAGMIIRAVFNNDSSTVLNDSDYDIENGTNLQYGQTSVTITYQGKSVEQAITVQKKESSNPDQEQEPSKEPSKQEEKAVNSTLTSAKCTISSIKAYYYNDDSSKDYTIVDTEISGITRNLSNDSYEYYYYLSPNKELNNITDWVKIDENQTANNKLTFTIDSRKLSNYDEVSKATKLYIYIKETVTKGGNQSVVVSKAMLFEKGESTIETYVDGAKAQSYNGSNSANQGNNNNSNNGGGATNNGSSTQGQTSNTTSPTKLPFTGNNHLLIVIIVMAIIGTVVFIKYEILNKSMK